MKHVILISCLVFCIKAAAQSPKVLIMNGERLSAIKKKAEQKDKAMLELLTELSKYADGLLEMKPVSVMDKAFTPVSGNKHDYMSQAPYFWYDSTKPNGLPYMRKDGQRNPEIYKITDRTYLGKLETAVRTLSLAWYLTGQEKYAAKAAGLLRTWFLDNATRMNPNLDYGQAIPGINNGRGIGIIETVALTGIADAAALLTGSAAWTKADHKALQDWYAQYLNWMLTSKNGNEEHAAKNNHGTWYYAQVIDFALFTGNTTKAKQLAEESKARMDGQLKRDGQQPLEIARTNGLGYSTMNLRGWFTVATLAQNAGIDLWNYKTPESAGIQTAFDWLMPFATGEQPWTTQQISKYNKGDFYPLLLQGYTAFKDRKYLMSAKELEKENTSVIIDLLYKE